MQKIRSDNPIENESFGHEKMRCNNCLMHGLSIYVYVYAQRLIGAAMTGAYYAVVPFIGVLLSVIIFKNALSPAFIMAVVLMALGAWLASSDEPLGQK